MANLTFAELAHGNGMLYVVDMKNGAVSAHKVKDVKDILSENKVIFLREPRTLLASKRSAKGKVMNCDSKVYTTDVCRARQIAAEVRQIEAMREQIKTKQAEIKAIIRYIKKS